MQAGMSFFPDKSGDGTSFRPESGAGRKSSAYRSLESFRIGNSIRAETVTRERTGFVLRVTGRECRDPKRFFRQQKPRPDRPKLKASIGNRPMGDQQKVPAVSASGSGSQIVTGPRSGGYFTSYFRIPDIPPK